ncbi:MAG: hypothetical protein ABSE51_19985 [Terracidiphilus sp.]|jgi:hypothetical protein
MTVTTHVRGRVYRDQQGRASGRHRHEQSLKSRIGKTAKQKRRVCLLSARDANWLEEYGTNQPCFGDQCHHAHHTRKQVEQMVHAGQLRWLDPKTKNVACWVDPRAWKGVRGSMQWVPIGVGMSQLERRELARQELQPIPDFEPQSDISAQNYQNEAHSSL